ncbi:DUF2795 domain-containing protein [Labedaea rhizosphaerae]|uniref:DUF2795 domain-containing protein n=1 Tax=Labedaea rhizosphaerae TaxID=598644 RepID=UPI001FB74BA1|nr:DUF2795 domain-containing protein [Labedaea rhizosphaerae]
MLDGLDYPAQRWQILVQAELYGAATTTKDTLRRLPPRTYADTGDVTRVLAAL